MLVLATVLTGFMGQADVLASLLQEDSERIERVDEAGATPLQAAATHGRANCVQLLLKAHASVNATDRAGFTPLIAAAGQGRVDCA